MSIFGGLRSGVSGLFVQSQSMAMISDNIANVNTVGYKLNRPQFSTLVTAQSSETLFRLGRRAVQGRARDRPAGPSVGLDELHRHRDLRGRVLRRDRSGDPEHHVRRL
jgi:flagellar basal body rod protein FlgG